MIILGCSILLSEVWNFFMVLHLFACRAGSIGTLLVEIGVKSIACGGNFFANFTVSPLDRNFTNFEVSVMLTC
jgi:hypothetical protein